MNTNKIVIGILAHVDAGKTTLAESILFECKSIRKLGRVDHKDAFLDTFDLERARGITIFSKQAQCSLGEIQMTLLDTPGHVDFSAETERCLRVLDYGILVISQADGISGHVLTLWRLLERYHIPVFIFVNKMDQQGSDPKRTLGELKRKLDEGCVDFDSEKDTDGFYENVAICEEDILERYLDGQSIEDAEIARLISERKLFPCYFGSALKLEGVKALLEGLERYTRCPQYPNEFGAKIYKIGRDEQGIRLTYMKVTGGCLKVKMPLTNRNVLLHEDRENSELWEEKADQIRIYSGASCQTVNEAQPGTICAVTGLSKTYAGEGLGIEPEAELPLLEPVLTYQIQLPQGCDVHGMLKNLRQLEEEEPQLHIVWNEIQSEIHALVMGEIQIEILKSMIQDRFHVEVQFGSGSILYKETIETAAEGVGHFEPLRHYAEVHLLLEPLERGSGLRFAAACSEDVLDRNWQRLIVTHLEEKRHVGVLTGSEITDMKITLITGKSHVKHTEGGDFRQATYRAVRQGLKRAKSLLLEPVYEYRLEIPTEMVGRALTDIQKMQGSFSSPEIQGELSIVTGIAPVSTMQSYQREVTAYTRGLGRLSCTLKGYEPCHNPEEVIEAISYDSAKDLENPADSVFCSHGAGFIVEWNRVEEYMHVDSGLTFSHPEEHSEEKKHAQPSLSAMSSRADEKELEEIFTRTYGAVKREKYNDGRTIYASEGKIKEKKIQKKESKEQYLLVDGYNIIFDWDELNELAKVNIEGARNRLMDILSNYQGYKEMTLILVFDAYKVEGNPGEVLKYNNINVVYTKEAETADQYIEKVVHEIGRKYDVTVATSDAMEQIIIMGQGAYRLSARGLKEEIDATDMEIRSTYLNETHRGKNYLFHHLPDGMADFMEEVRLGRKKFSSIIDRDSLK